MRRLNYSTECYKKNMQGANLGDDDEQHLDEKANSS